MTFQEIKDRGNQYLAVASVMVTLTPTPKDDLSVAFLKDILNQPSTETLWSAFQKTPVAQKIVASGKPVD